MFCLFILVLILLSVSVYFTCLSVCLFFHYFPLCLSNCLHLPVLFSFFLSVFFCINLSVFPCFCLFLCIGLFFSLPVSYVTLNIRLSISFFPCQLLTLSPCTPVNYNSFCLPFQLSLIPVNLRHVNRPSPCQNFHTLSTITLSVFLPVNLCHVNRPSPCQNFPTLSYNSFIPVSSLLCLNVTLPSVYPLFPS